MAKDYGFTKWQRYVMGQMLDAGLTLSEDAKGNPYLIRPDGSIERVHKLTPTVLAEHGYIEKAGRVYRVTDKGRQSYETSKKIRETRKRNAYIRTRLEGNGVEGAKESGLLAARNGLYVELFSTLIREVADLRVAIDNLTKALT